MASIRTLPSGRFQASVLLDSGKRQTVVKDTAEEARSWALEMEQERDRLREEKRALSEAARPRLVIDALRQLSKEGLLTDEQRFEIVRILRGDHSDEGKDKA